MSKTFTKNKYLILGVYFDLVTVILLLKKSKTTKNNQNNEKNVRRDKKWCLDIQPKKMLTSGSRSFAMAQTDKRKDMFTL